MSKPMILGGDPEALKRPMAGLSPEDLDYLFLEASKPDTQWFVGVEVELFPFLRADLAPAPHASIAKILKRIGQGDGLELSYEENGELTGVSGNGRLISLEPGGQLEFATAPHRSLKRLRDEIHETSNELVRAADAEGMGLLALGQQPYATRDTAPHMPKPRYDHMRRYLGQADTRGLDMMHLTGSIQCTVDFQNERNLVDKVRTAAKASPFLSALVAASPFTAGKPNGFKTVRYEIWLHTDDERCGVWPEMFDEEGLTPRRYVARALKAAPMFFIRDGQFVEAELKPFSHFVQHGFQGTEITLVDFLDHLTTFFPEIRPKGYVEMRGADCLFAPEAVAVAGFWRGILDDEPTRIAVDERLKDLDYAAIRELQPKVAREGLDADSAAGPVREVIRWLVEAAHQRLHASAPDCAECVEPLLERAQRGVSPADEMLELAAKTSVKDAVLSRAVTVSEA